MRTVDPVKHEKKRQDILRAALACFVRDGFRGASTTDICAEAKMSPGHLYHYFPSKEAMIEALVKQGLEHAASRFEEVLAAPNIVDALLIEFERTSISPSRAQALSLDALAEASRNPGFARIIQGHTEAIRSLLVGFIDQAQGKGKVDPDLDPEATANILIAVVDGVRAMPLRSPAADIKARRDHLRMMLSRFLAPPSASAATRRAPGRAGRKARPKTVADRRDRTP